MTNSEEAYAEALRRVRKAEASGATALDLSGAPDLKQLPRELEQLTRLKKLYLSFCEQLVDLRPLAGLRGLGAAQLFGAIAVALAAVNIFGGFIVTHRMLSMFKKKTPVAKK